MHVKIEDGKLMIVVDVSPAAVKAAALSKSAKNKLIATTHGFTRYGEFGVSLNVTAPLA